MKNNLILSYFSVTETLKDEGIYLNKLGVLHQKKEEEVC